MGNPFIFEQPNGLQQLVRDKGIEQIVSKVLYLLTDHNERPQNLTQENIRLLCLDTVRSDRVQVTSQTDINKAAEIAYKLLYTDDPISLDEA